MVSEESLISNNKIIIKTRILEIIKKISLKTLPSWSEIRDTEKIHPGSRSRIRGVKKHRIPDPPVRLYSSLEYTIVTQSQCDCPSHTEPVTVAVQVIFFWAGVGIGCSTDGVHRQQSSDSATTLHKASGVTRGSGFYPDSMTLWIRIWNPDPDPWARKMKKKMHFSLTL
jgi:hypothetical protein